MIRSSRHTNGPMAATSRRGQQGRARIVLLLLVTFLLGLGAGGIWIYRTLRKAAPAEAVNTSAGNLSDSTLATLKGLDAPLTIHYYALLDSATVSAGLNDYATRVRALLNEYQSEGNGRVKVTRFDSKSDAANNAAVAEGMKPFNLEQGDACYLGIFFSYKGKTEVMPLLALEWEKALESDITRAIGRLSVASMAKPTASRPVETATPNAAAIAEVKSIIPDVGILSEEECSRVLKEKALAAFTAATQEMETKVKEAEQQLVAAQSGGSEEAKQAARAALQKAQMQQVEKLKKVAAQLQDQLAALKLIKAK